jgi:cytoskeleton protein RodZ
MTHIEKPNNINKAQATASSEPEPLHNSSEDDLSDNSKIIGPGQILSDARKKAGLTQQEVASKLNFRLTLVNEIESELFNSNLPETYNRGYLRSYAKLVNVSQDDVLVSYEQLNITKAQVSKLQSFSKGTEKLAESNRIMWISYIILAILIGSTMMWWLQNNTEQAQTLAEDIEINTQSADGVNENQASDLSTVNIENVIKTIAEAPLATTTAALEQQSSDIAPTAVNVDNSQVSEIDIIALENSPIVEEELTEVALTEVTFTFSGDCWVNISDSTGERIAWGVKKLGYVMTISGQAPFDVTLGRPELVAINFADEVIDMNQFNSGNIAKFTLPVTN